MGVTIAVDTKLYEENDQTLFEKIMPMVAELQDTDPIIFMTV